MGDALHLVLHGLDRVTPRLRQEVVYILRQEFGPIVAEAGRTLKMTVGPRTGDLNLYFDTTTAPARICQNTLLGEDASGVVWVEAHRNLRVCSQRDRAGNRDTRRFLTRDWLLGRAVANTAMHELGHFIANLDHSADTSNYMMTGSMPTAQRTLTSQRKHWAGRQSFSSGQRARLVAQLQACRWLGDFEVEFSPGP
jgi:hypothetical protein